MSIVIYSSTPRVGGNSDILADAALEGVRAADSGGEAFKVSIGRLSIAPCTACESCMSSVETECTIHDDAIVPLRRLRSADAVLFASPIYTFTVSAQLKLLLDRAYSLFATDRWDTLAGLRVGAVFTYGDEDRDTSGVRNAISTVEDMTRFWGATLVGVVEASCSARREVLANEAAIEAARDLGRRLVTA